jgi:hypothetical protein
MNTTTGTLESGYNYELKTPDKKYMPFYNMTVTLPHDVPHFFVDCRLNDLEPKLLLHEFSRKQQIVLEGSFSEFYDAYSSEAQRLNFLSLVTPNIMYTIMKQGLKCDIELVDKRLQIFWPMPTGTSDPTADIIAAANELTSQLDRLFRRYDKIADLQPDDPGIAAAIKNGTRLQNGTTETKAPRTYVDVADIIAWIGVGVVTTLLAISLFNTSDEGDAIRDDTSGFIMALVVVSLVVALFVVALPYWGFIRKRIVKRYRRGLEARFEAARHHLG